MERDEEKSPGKVIESEEQSESRRILERVARDTESIGASSMARVASRVAAHFRADDNTEDDAVEIWGKRVARLLALIAFVWLVYHILTRYILPA